MQVFYYRAFYIPTKKTFLRKIETLGARSFYALLVYWNYQGCLSGTPAWVYSPEIPPVISNIPFKELGEEELKGEKYV